VTIICSTYDFSKIGPWLLCLRFAAVNLVSESGDGAVRRGPLACQLFHFDQQRRGHRRSVPVEVGEHATRQQQNIQHQPTARRRVRHLDVNNATPTLATPTTLQFLTQ